MWQVPGEMRMGFAASLLLTLGAASTSIAAAAEKPAVVLAKDGKPQATIVIGKDASGLQRGPAKELQEYLRRITGATLPITDDGRPPQGDLVLVGASRLTREMGIDPQVLGGDAFVIKTTPGRLVLAGHDARLGDSTSPKHTKCGTANAVSAFLHDVCGVRWFIPGKLG